MTDINYNAGNHTLEISVRIFTDDFEGALRKNYTGKIDLTHPQDPAKAGQQVKAYIAGHLQVAVDGRPVPLDFVGFEQQEESTWCYFEAPRLAALHQLQVRNSLLHDFTGNQVNMLHVKANGKEQSSKLDFPNTAAAFRLE